MMSNYDAVHKPSHYTEGRNFEPKDVIRDWGLNFNLGNAVKYLARAGRKDDIVQDLKKAQEYIQFEIDAIEAERNPVVPTTLKSISLPKPKMVALRSVGITVPVGTPTEDIIKEFITKLHGGE